MEKYTMNISKMFLYQCCIAHDNEVLQAFIIGVKCRGNHKVKNASSR